LTVLIWSSPLTTERSELSITHLETKAPLPPWARGTPSVPLISWFMSTVNVPSPLSKAPRPSGMPAMRYVPPAAPCTESPVVSIDLKTTPACERTRYGDCELLGPVEPPGAAIATAARAPASAPASAKIRSFLM
jgi:hypothetical protein